MHEVLLDVTRLTGRLLKGRLPTGVDRVGLAYVRHFADRARAVVRLGAHGWIASRRTSLQLFDLLLSPSRRGFAGQAGWLVGRTWCDHWNQSASPGALLFNLGHSGLERADYPRHLRRLGARPLFMVHDLIPITHPEYCRPGERNRHAVRMDHVLRLAGGVITNSAATLEALRAHAESAGLRMPPALAAPLAPAALPRPASARLLPAPYFVMLGTIEPRKNHGLILQLWRRLVEHLGERAPRLIVIGRRGWECENTVDMLERCEALRGVVIERPACSDAELATWLGHAQALLFPSFAEGYGLPLMEALSLGVPVVASDLPVFREIAGSLPDYLDPLDGIGWLARIASYATDTSPERIAQLERLKGFAPPSWASHFARVDAWLERLP
ncbi:glycosyltransferase family 4 protein [Ralstonia solanacearum]|uniref:glycosyltransferase family 4 protein n=1 Tax=Ralstonia solanacearum TaxID=305 RepID=UPI0001D97EC6|nr:glycosyltransferase family 1 protein [Ralstonia solanacearum]CBJ51880.1 putative glycosyltransferase [Ralstonia solanacearum PSI07]